MSEKNPYEAPQSTVAATNLGRRIATMLLEARRTGYPLSLHLRWQAKSYLISTILFALLITLESLLNLTPLVNLMIGLYIGLITRDLGIARAHTRTWKIQEQFLDWDKVQRVADGEPLPSENR